MGALLVVLVHFHTFRTVRAPGPVHLLTLVAHNISASGFVGVSFFFVLSGFILAYNYLDTQGHMRVAPRDFWISRIARIYPVYLLAFVLAAVPYLIHHLYQVNPIPICKGSNPIVGNNPAVTIMAALTATQAWLPCSALLWNRPGWSLSAEAFFYLLFPFLALHIARLQRRQLYVAIAALWATSLTAPLVYVVTNPDGLGNTWLRQNGYWLGATQFNPLLRLPEFLIGVALGRLFVLKTANMSMNDRSRLTDPRLLSCVAALGIVIVLSTGQILPFPLLFNGFMAPLFAMLIYNLAFGKGPLAALYSLPVMVLLGEASYATYILHYPIHDWMVFALQHLHIMRNPYFMYSNGFFAAYFCLVIAASIFSLRVIEGPARRAVVQAFTRRLGEQVPRVELPASEPVVVTQHSS